MKNLILLSLFIIVFVTMLSAQQAAILNNSDGKPAYIALRLPDTTYIHQFRDEVPKHVTFDGQYSFSPNICFSRAPYNVPESLDFSMDTIEPGTLPEGDLPYKVAYSADGSKFIVLYRHSNNVMIYNASDYSVLANIYVGKGPEGLFVSKEHLYVTCYFSGEVYVISLSDFVIEDIIAVQPHPSLIELNASESIMYVGFPIGEYSRMACLAAYDLNSHEML